MQTEMIPFYYIFAFLLFVGALLLTALLVVQFYKLAKLDVIEEIERNRVKADNSKIEYKEVI